MLVKVLQHKARARVKPIISKGRICGNFPITSAKTEAPPKSTGTITNEMPSSKGNSCHPPPSGAEDAHMMDDVIFDESLDEEVGMIIAR